jgi:di/tricarboxylate transporter
MSDMSITFVILGVTMVMFVWGRFSLDTVALSSLLALFLTGVVDLDQALSGFSNSTVILIGTLFVVGEGLSKTGLTAWFGDKLVESSGGSAARLLVLSMAGAALMSGVISNTATVAALMPAVVMAAWGVRSNPSAFLIPLAFASTVGGLLTLTGTAPNVVIAEALDASGFRPFRYFEFALIGAPLLLVTIAYMMTMGKRLLPSRTRSAPVNLDQEMHQLADAYSLGGELYRLRVRVGSELAGSTLRQSDLGRRFGVAVLEIHEAPTNSLIEQHLPWLMRERLERLRRDPLALPAPDQIIEAHDVLIVTGTADQVHRLEVEMRLGVLPIDDAGQGLGDLLSQEIGIAEVLLTPRSSYIGKVVTEGGLGPWDLLVVGIRRGDRLVPKTEPLQGGDALLVRGTWAAIGHLAEEPRNFVVVGRPESLARQVTHLNNRSVVALLSLAGMVALMVTGAVPLVIAALVAAGAMIVGGCLTTTQAYRAVSWSTVVLIGAMIPMAVALETTGGAQWVADRLIDAVGGAGPRTLLAGIMIVTLVSSQVISNTATAVLMSPIVLGIASGLGVDPHPLMMGLAVAASTAFIAPIATAPNLLVMAPGDYRFRDFPRVGAPLSALFLIVAVALIPVIWAF